MIDTKLKEIDIQVKGYKRFKDDTDIVLRPVDRRKKFVEGCLVNKTEKEIRKLSFSRRFTSLCFTHLFPVNSLNFPVRYVSLQSMNRCVQLLVTKMMLVAYYSAFSK